MGIHDDFNDYSKVYGFVMRITAYLMHRLNQNNRTSTQDIENLIETLFEEGKWTNEMWQRICGNDTLRGKDKKSLITDEAIGCLYSEGRNSYCFLHRTIQEYLCADLLVNYSSFSPSNTINGIF